MNLVLPRHAPGLDKLELVERQNSPGFLEDLHTVPKLFTVGFVTTPYVAKNISDPPSLDKKSVNELLCSVRFA